MRAVARALVPVCLMSCLPAADDGSELATRRIIKGGQFEASGVAHVPGTSMLLFVDDGRPLEIFLIELTSEGAQVGAAVPIPLGASVTDLEGITSDGHHFYVVGSQSKKTGADGDGLVRFAFDPVARRVNRVESVQGLKAWLTTNVAELAADADALDIEGLAWDPLRGRLLLGLRAPLIADSALIIPIQLVDSGAAFSLDNLRIDGPAIRLPLNGAGIRSLEYDATAGAFQLIAAVESDRAGRGFRLMEWDGTPGSPVKDVRGFPSRQKPEGIARASLDSLSVTVVVFDTGHFTVLR